MTWTEFAIIIATKDRAEKVRELLKSISKSTVKPKKIVVISSGSPIYFVISEFKQDLNIDYFHSELTGQVNQKKIGITRLGHEVSWVLFLDDDLVLVPDALEKAFEILSHYRESGADIIGIGLGLTPTTRLPGASKLQILIGRALRLYSTHAGKVLRSGQGVSYLGNPEPILTEWLNGASMWRIESALDYISLMPSSRYAACEDLVFSYRQSKKGKLLFAPGARVLFQDLEPNDYNNRQAIVSSTAWRYFFVKSNPELSKWLLLYSQLGRLAYILLTKPGDLDAVRAGIWSVKHLCIAVLGNKDAMFLINKIP